MSRDSKISYQHGRKQILKASAGLKPKIFTTNDPAPFWNEVLIPNIADRFNASPTHTAAELTSLMQLFPENIKVYTIGANELLAGAVLYIFDNVVHTQYLSATNWGKEVGALDVLVDHLMGVYSNRSYFSFGTSATVDGINAGLHNWKESFGARAHLLDVYAVKTNNYTLLDRYA
jgi:hypothetical protein